MPDKSSDLVRFGKSTLFSAAHFPLNGFGPNSCAWQLRGFCLSRRTGEFIEPMDCTPVSKLTGGLDWTFEIELDGYRAVAVKSDRGVNLFSRRHEAGVNSLTSHTLLNKLNVTL